MYNIQIREDFPGSTGSKNSKGGRMIPFQKAYRLDRAGQLIDRALASGRTEGDGPMSERCRAWLSDRLGTPDVLMMTSCTHSLEEAVRLIGLRPNDEVIVPSFNFPSAANAVLLAGGTVVYGEVEAKHLTLDPDHLQAHINERTRAVIVVHYGGASCDMSKILALAEARGIVVIEDCAHSFLTRYQGRLTGTLGHFGCFSFHGTKDIVAGEGGALVVNDTQYAAAARLFRQKGTNRDDFSHGKTKRYEWVSPGSSYAPGELQMALLASQLELSDEILRRRRFLFRRYHSHFSAEQRASFYDRSLFSCSSPQPDTEENGHLFFLLLRQAAIADGLVLHLNENGIDARTHFVPLHESSFGEIFTRPENQFTVEDQIGRRLVRLPLFPSMTEAEQDAVMTAVDRYLMEGIS